MRSGTNESIDFDCSFALPNDESSAFFQWFTCVKAFRWNFRFVRPLPTRAPLRPSYRLNRSESVFFFVPFCRWHYFLILIRRTLRITRSNVNDIETHIQVVPHAEIKTKRKCHEALLCENSTRSTTNNSCREEMRARAHTRKSILLQMTR